MKLKQLAAGVAASTIMFAAGAASAATLSFANTGDGLAWDKLGSSYSAGPCGNPTECYDPSGDAASLALDLHTFDKDTSPGLPGLMLDEGTLIKVTFLGKEADAKNVAFSGLGGSISNEDSIGSSYITYVGSGNLAFAFESALGTSASNTTGTILGDAAIGFSEIFDNGKTVYAFFDDSGAGNPGDRDFDDMVVRISVVPLPAGGLLLLTALGGFAAVRRKKKAA